MTPLCSRLAVWACMACVVLAIGSGVRTFVLSRAIKKRTVALERLYREQHAVYHHGLKKNYQGVLLWGAAHEYPIFTNSLGFKDASVQAIARTKNPKKRRILFIGDSFTEGVGLPWEHTFVGQFAATMPHLEVLNAGVASYAPSLEYRKINYLLEQEGVEFDEVVFFLDISDPRDEITYMKESGDMPTPPRTPTAVLSQKFYTIFLYARALARYGNFFLQERLGIDDRAMYHLAESRWTLEQFQAESEVQQCFAPAGLERALREMQRWMDASYQLLSARGIGLSLAVYPWPAQLHYEDLTSRQVSMWREWCAGKCKHFINLFPDFFRVKQTRKDWYTSVYIDGDVHFNAHGHAIIAHHLSQLAWK